MGFIFNFVERYRVTLSHKKILSFHILRPFQNDIIDLMATHTSVQPTDKFEKLKLCLSIAKKENVKNQGYFL